MFVSIDKRTLCKLKKEYIYSISLTEVGNSLYLECNTQGIWAMRKQRTGPRVQIDLSNRPRTFLRHSQGNDKINFPSWVRRKSEACWRSTTI